MQKLLTKNKFYGVICGFLPFDSEEMDKNFSQSKTYAMRKDRVTFGGYPSNNQGVMCERLVSRTLICGFCLYARRLETTIAV